MNLAPVLRQRHFDANGVPLAGGQLFSYAAGTTTPQATYSNATGTTNANPVILDANGYADVFLDPTLAYKFVLEDSLNNVIWTVDNVTFAVGITTWNANSIYQQGNLVVDTSGQGKLYVSLTNNNQNNALTSVANWRMFNGGTRTVTANTTLLYTDDIVRSNSTSGALTMTLPACASTPIGTRLTINDVGTAGFGTTVQGSGGDLISGVNIYGTTLKGSCLIVVNNGTSWDVAVGPGPVSNGVTNLGLSTGIGSNLLTVALKQRDGATDPTGQSPVFIAFRDATLTNGDYVSRSVTGAISISTVATGCTLGLVSAQNQYIWVYAIDNAGTVELALAGNKFADEGTRYSTTAIGASATDGLTLYSTTARTNVAVRLIGRIKVNEATSGTFASAPTEVAVLPLQQVNPRSEVWLYTDNGYGSTNTVIKRFLTVGKNVGTAITYADSATLGATFTINEDGVYDISFSGTWASGDYSGISVNSTQLTTSINTINAADRRAMTVTNGSAQSGFVHRTLILSAGDVVRAHTDGAAAAGSQSTHWFNIVQVSK